MAYEETSSEDYITNISNYIRTSLSSSASGIPQLIHILSSFRCILNPKWLNDCLDNLQSVPLDSRLKTIDSLEPFIQNVITSPLNYLPKDTGKSISFLKINKTDIIAFVWTAILYEDLTKIVPCNNSSNIPSLPLDFLPNLPQNDIESTNYIKTILNMGTSLDSNGKPIKQKPNGLDPILVTGFFQIIDAIDIGISLNSQYNSIVDNKPDDEGRRMVPLIDEEIDGFEEGNTINPSQSSYLNMETSQAKSRKAGVYIHKTILFTITDGRHIIQALEAEPLPGIANVLSIAMGAKLFINKARFRRGMVKIDKSNSLYIGSNVRLLNVDPITHNLIDPLSRVEKKIKTMLHIQ